MTLNPALIDSIERTVAKRDSKIVEAGRLRKILESYDGSEFVLKKVMQRFGGGNLDPYEAISKMELVNILTERDEEGLITKDTASNQWLSLQGYSYRSKEDGQTLVFGSPSITKLMQTFGTDAQKIELDSEQDKREKVARQLVEKKKENLEAKIAAFQDNPETLKDIRSRHARISLQTIRMLNEELTNRLIARDYMQHGAEAAGTSKGKSYQVAADIGGGTLSYIRRNIKTVPEYIRKAFLDVTTPRLLMTLDNLQTQQKIEVLTSWEANERYVNKSSILGGYLKDLNYILALPGDNEIVQRFGLPNLTKVRDIIAKPEITFTEAKKVFDNIETYNIAEIRVLYSQSHYSRHEKDFEAIVAELKPLFMIGEKWIPDALDISIPMDRIKKAIYFAALTRDDFEKIRDVLRLRTIAPYKDGMLRSVPLEDIKELIDGVVIAKRKVDYLKKYLEEKKIPFKDPDNMELFLFKHERKLLKGKNYNLTENFEQEFGIDLREFMKRAESIERQGMTRYQEPDQFWRNNRYKLAHELETGLYVNTKDRAERMKPLLEKVLSAEALEGQLRADYNLAKDFMRTELIKERIKLPFENESYVVKEKADNVRAVVAEKARMEGIVGVQRLQELILERSELKNRLFYSGTLLNLGTRRYNDKDEPESVSGNLRIVDVSRLEDFIINETDGYQKSEEVPGLKEKIRIVLPFKWRENFKGISRDMFINSLSVRFDQDFYITRELADEVNQGYEKLKESIRKNPNISGGVEHFMEGELYDSSQTYELRIKGTKPKDKDKFKESFFGLAYNPEKGWFIPRLYSRIDAYHLLTKIEDYNKRYKKSLTLELVKPGQ